MKGGKRQPDLVSRAQKTLIGKKYQGGKFQFSAPPGRTEAQIETFVMRKAKQQNIKVSRWIYNPKTGQVLIN